MRVTPGAALALAPIDTDTGSDPCTPANLNGLPVSAGVALYVAATDLVPEVNREPGIRMALVFFAGVGGFLLLRSLLPNL